MELRKEVCCFAAKSQQAAILTLFFLKPIPAL
jgi:hypothetical protein